MCVCPQMSCVSVWMCVQYLIWCKRVCACVWVQSAGGKERRGTAAASDSCVINIRTSEGGREGERAVEKWMWERECADFQRMGGAALLRNAKHHINSTVKKKEDWWWLVDRERGRVLCLQSMHAAILPYSQVSSFPRRAEWLSPQELFTHYSFFFLMLFFSHSF